ncbi:MAG: DUF5989 family protein [Verrucomicrobiales bacterium]
MSERGPISGKKDELDTLAESGEVGFLREFFDFLRENKKWWLIPIVVVLLLLGLLMLAGGTGAAPFIYSLF